MFIALQDKGSTRINVAIVVQNIRKNYRGQEDQK